MNDSATITRRAFLQASGAAGGGFVLGFFLPGFARAMSDEAAAEGKFAPNAFVRIGSDDIVTVIVGRSEMGHATPRDEDHQNRGLAAGSHHRLASRGRPD